MARESKWFYVGTEPRAQLRRQPTRREQAQTRPALGFPPGNPFLAGGGFSYWYPPVSPKPKRNWDPGVHLFQAVVANPEEAATDAPRLTQAWLSAWQLICADPGIERPDLIRTVVADSSLDITAATVGSLVRAAADGGIVTLRKTRRGGGRWRYRVYPGTGWTRIWRRSAPRE